MLRLQSLIIERIGVTQQIMKDREEMVRQLAPIVSIEGEFKANRAVLKFLSSLRKRERERAGEE